MKKIFLFATALLMSASMFAKTSVITYTAEEKLQEATEGWSKGLHLNAFYAADSTQLTVTHTFDEAESVGTITLNGEVAIIGYNAFFQTSITSVTIPEGVTMIGVTAFFKTSLTSVTIPASVTTIGMGIFAGCSALASVTFLGNACQEGIGELAFEGVGDPDPALLTLNGTWAKENQPDEDGNWYGGKFELAEDPTTLPTLFGDGVKGNKFFHNGQLIIRAENKNFSVLGQEVR